MMCPRCGYCPHCGRSNASPYQYVPPIYPQPWPVNPWITWGTNTRANTGGVPPISASGDAMKIETRMVEIPA